MNRKNTKYLFFILSTLFIALQWSCTSKEKPDQKETKELELLEEKDQLSEQEQNQEKRQIRKLAVNGKNKRKDIRKNINQKNKYKLKESMIN